MNRFGLKILALMIFAVVAANAAQVSAQGGKVYAWARIYTATSVGGKSSITESAFYTSINRIDAGGVEKAKQLATSYFNQKIIPYYEGDRQLKIRDVQVKTFATLEEADDARYEMFKKDQQTLNPKDEEGFPSTGFFNCSLADGGARAAWMSDVREVSVSNIPQWQYFYVPVKLVRKDEDKFVEQRLYFTEPFEVYVTGSDTRRWQDIFNKYFGAVVDEPLQKKLGIEVQWTGNEVDLEPGYIRSDTGNTYREAKEELNHLIENRVGYDQPMLLFDFTDRGVMTGETTANVRCFQNCQLAKVALTANAQPSTTKKN